MTKKPSHIKGFLKAKTPDSLRVLMFRNNVKTSSYHDYQIIFDGQNWFAWYEQEADNLLTERYGELANEQRSS